MSPAHADDAGCPGDAPRGSVGTVALAAPVNALAGLVAAEPDSALAIGDAAAVHQRSLAALRARRARAFVALTRPRQWVKNLLVIAAPAAAGVLTQGDVPRHVALTFAAFCLLSAGTYAFNDVRDVLEDRDHPRKRRRPVAAGDLATREALRAAAVLMLAGLLICLAVRPLLLVVGAGYLAVTLSYSLLWRRIAFADVGAIAGGFVLRAVAGGVGAPVGLSTSFVLVVTFGAVFLAAGKRRAELIRPRLDGDDGLPARRVLTVYTPRRLRALLAGSSTLAFAAYCVWALSGSVGDPWRPLTLIPFAAGLCRYGVLLGRGAGEAPEVLLLEDRVLRPVALTWAIIFAMSVYAPG